MASAALVVSRREESKTGLSIKNGPREVGFHQDPENPPISQVHMPPKILARNPPSSPGAANLIPVDTHAAGAHGAYPGNANQRVVSVD